MSERADLLVEIGTEELPPKTLPGLMAAFAEGLSDELRTLRIEAGTARTFGSPRRLAVIIADVAFAQTERTVEHKGPPVNIAFDDTGEPRPAACAFAKKYGVDVADLSRLQTDKGEWLAFSTTEEAAATAALLPQAVSAALARLPIPRPMRWGVGDIEFVRPVHWVVLLHGEQAVTGNVLGVKTGNVTRGHRFMAPEELVIATPADYARQLEGVGFVVADFVRRRASVAQAVEDAAQAAGGSAVASAALLDEVTALVEWPVALTGRFDKAFLSLPREVIESVLSGHQRYFPVVNADGSLLPAFVTVANLASRDPERVREGNERVVRPRLEDADFFWRSDKRTPLAERETTLADVVYQRGLGSLSDKSARLASLAKRIAALLQVDDDAAARAASLAKCDLVTLMVGEFPELQGTMGGYYARADGETEAVATAIAEHYRPRFAGDDVPQSNLGCCVALADKLDVLCGNFALGKKPSGNRDPFGLRRAALGIVRILVERELDLDLKALIAEALSAQPVSAEGSTCDAVYEYIVERLRAYSLERPEVSSEAFDAVRVRAPASLADFVARLDAVVAFVELPSAQQLAAANKRIANILRQDQGGAAVTPDSALFAEAAEGDLFAALDAARTEVKPLVEQRAYTAALTRLAALQGPVDRFFEDVMVMAEDDTLRHNRLSLLTALRQQFLEVADISRLSMK